MNLILTNVLKWIIIMYIKKGSEIMAKLSYEYVKRNEFKGLSEEEPFKKDEI